MTTVPTSAEGDGLLDEAIAALRAAERIVQKIADDGGGCRVDGGVPLSTGQIVALAWDTGLMGGFEGMR